MGLNQQKEFCEDDLDTMEDSENLLNVNNNSNNISNNSHFLDVNNNNNNNGDFLDVNTTNSSLDIPKEMKDRSIKNMKEKIEKYINNNNNYSNNLQNKSTKFLYLNSLYDN